MTETPPGSDWWQASDGRWYAPELHPSRTASPMPHDEESSPSAAAVVPSDPFAWVRRKRDAKNTDGSVGAEGSVVASAQEAPKTLPRNDDSSPFCPECGAEGNSGTRFCSSCGSALSVESTPRPSRTSQSRPAGSDFSSGRPLIGRTQTADDAATTRVGKQGSGRQARRSLWVLLAAGVVGVGLIIGLSPIRQSLLGTSPPPTTWMLFSNGTGAFMTWSYSGNSFSGTYVEFRGSCPGYTTQLHGSYSGTAVQLTGGEWSGTVTGHFSHGNLVVPSPFAGSLRSALHLTSTWAFTPSTLQLWNSQTGCT